MRSVYNYIIKPKGQRYNNSVSVGEKNLILNTEIYNHQYVNREAKIISLPSVGSSELNIGDTVIVHHNVFRRWHDIKGRERNSKAFYKENMYFVSEDQVFAYKQQQDYNWRALKGFCFIKPIKSVDKFSTEEEQPLMGIVKYTDGSVNVGDLVGFRPNSEYEFVIDGQKLYRVYSHFITIKYEYQGNEEEYNPSWAQSS